MKVKVRLPGLYEYYAHSNSLVVDGHVYTLPSNAIVTPVELLSLLKDGTKYKDSMGHIYTKCCGIFESDNWYFLVKNNLGINTLVGDREVEPETSA